MGTTQLTRPYGLMVKRITSTRFRYDEILSSILSEGTNTQQIIFFCFFSTHSFVRVLIYFLPSLVSSSFAIFFC